MGVLIECISVVAKCEAIAAHYPGGLRGFEADCPNASYCSDDYLARVGFMNQAETKQVVQRLENCGLTFFNGRECVDLAVVDEQSGPTAPCPWLKIATHEDGYKVAWLEGTPASPMAAPRDFSTQQSRGMHRVLDSEVGRLVSRGREGSLYKYLDTRTGKIVYSPTAAASAAPERSHDPPRSSTHKAGQQELQPAYGPTRPNDVATARFNGLANFALFIGGPIGLIFGALDHGIAGAITGLATAFWSSVTLKIGVRPRESAKILALGGSAAVIGCAYLGGWRWGWASAVGGVIATMILGRMFEKGGGRV